MTPQNDERRAGLWAALLLVLVGALPLLGCAGPEAQAPTPKRPLDEARAIDVIASAIVEFKLQPEHGSPITVPHGRRLSVDVAVVGRQLGIAYVTEAERRDLQDSIPAYDVGSTALRLVRDLEDRKRIILLLHDSAYTADDAMGTEREQSSMMTEHRLKRDVRDFLARANSEGWP